MVRVLTVCVVALASAWLARSPVARACDEPPDLCDWSERFTAFDAAHTRVAPDGVLLFSFSRGGGEFVDDAQALGFVTVEVTVDGQSSAGRLELVRGVDSYAFWRPEVPLAPGGAVIARVAIDNDSLAWDGSPCNFAEQLEQRFSVTDDAVGGPSVPAYAFRTGYETSASRPSLDGLECCDGAFPSERPSRCGGTHTEWDKGFCANRQRLGFATGIFELTEVWPEEVASLIAIRLLSDGAVVAETSALAPRLSSLRASTWRASFEVVNIATGAVASSDAHLADGGAGGPLGDHDVDVGAELDANCAGEPYTCAIAGAETERSWDPDRCDPPQEAMDDEFGTLGADDLPWSRHDSEDATPCACRAARGFQGSSWLLLAVLAVSRRRRAYAPER